MNFNISVHFNYKCGKTVYPKIYAIRDERGVVHDVCENINEVSNFVNRHTTHICVEELGFSNETFKPNIKFIYI